MENQEQTDASVQSGEFFNNKHTNIYKCLCGKESDIKTPNSV